MGQAPSVSASSNSMECPADEAHVKVKLQSYGAGNKTIDRLFYLSEKSPSIEVGRATSHAAKPKSPSPSNCYIRSPIMSRFHAEFVFGDKKHPLKIVDLGSTHGTFVHDERLEANQEKILQSDRIVTFGAQVHTGSDDYLPTTFLVSYEWRDPLLPPPTMKYFNGLAGIRAPSLSDDSDVEPIVAARNELREAETEYNRLLSQPRGLPTPVLYSPTFIDLTGDSIESSVQSIQAQRTLPELDQGSIATGAPFLNENEHVKESYYDPVRGRYRLDYLEDDESDVDVEQDEDTTSAISPPEERDFNSLYDASAAVSARSMSVGSQAEDNTDSGKAATDMEPSSAPQYPKAKSCENLESQQLFDSLGYPTWAPQGAHQTSSMTTVPAPAAQVQSAQPMLINTMQQQESPFGHSYIPSTYQHRSGTQQVWGVGPQYQDLSESNDKLEKVMYAGSTDYGINQEEDPDAVDADSVKDSSGAGTPDHSSASVEGESTDYDHNCHEDDITSQSSSYSHRSPSFMGSVEYYEALDALGATDSMTSLEILECAWSHNDQEKVMSCIEVIAEERDDDEMFRWLDTWAPHSDDEHCDTSDIESEQESQVEATTSGTQYESASPKDPSLSDLSQAQERSPCYTPGSPSVPTYLDDGYNITSPSQFRSVSPISMSGLGTRHQAGRGTANNDYAHPVMNNNTLTSLTASGPSTPAVPAPAVAEELRNYWSDASNEWNDEEPAEDSSIPVASGKDNTTELNASSTSRKRKFEEIEEEEEVKEEEGVTSMIPETEIELPHSLASLYPGANLARGDVLEQGAHPPAQDARQLSKSPAAKRVKTSGGFRAFASHCFAGAVGALGTIGVAALLVVTTPASIQQAQLFSNL